MRCGHVDLLLPFLLLMNFGFHDHRQAGREDNVAKGSRRTADARMTVEA